MPVTLVGATVNGRPNYLTVAHVGIMNHAHPAYITVGLGKMHYTNAGIKENKTFSVNIPSEDMVAETDYCGIVTGRNTDKAALFEAFYGELKTAPMITECPVNIECVLRKKIHLGVHDLFLGEIVSVHVDQEILDEEGEIDFAKLSPFVFNQGEYWSLGKRIGIEGFSRA